VNYYCYSVLTVIAVGRVHCQASVNPALTLTSHKGKEFVDQLSNHQLLKEHHQGVCLVFDNWHEIYHMYMNI